MRSCYEGYTRLYWLEGRHPENEETNPKDHAKTKLEVVYIGFSGILTHATVLVSLHCDDIGYLNLCSEDYE